MAKLKKILQFINNTQKVTLRIYDKSYVIFDDHSEGGLHVCKNHLKEVISYIREKQILLEWDIFLIEPLCLNGSESHYFIAKNKKLHNLMHPNEEVIFRILHDPSENAIICLREYLNNFNYKKLTISLEPGTNTQNATITDIMQNLTENTNLPIVLEYR